MGTSPLSGVDSRVQQPVLTSSIIAQAVNKTVEEVSVLPLASFVSHLI